MKKTNNNGKKLSIIVASLAVILISMISFYGVFVHKNGGYKNIIENFDLAMELKGSRLLILSPSTETKTVTKDKDGNVTEEEATEENGYTTEEVSVNNEEDLTEANFKASKKVVEGRLKDLKFDEYTIREDVDTGAIAVELDENDDTDSVVASLYAQGKFEIKDSKTNEVLMDNSMIKKAEVLYGSTTNGTSVYLSIEFNKEGKEKFKQITTDYKTIEKSEESDSEENASEESSEEQKEIKMELDGESIIETSFDTPIENGKLQLNVGQASNDADKLKDYIKQAQNVTVLLNSGKMPVEYTVTTNKYIKASNMKLTNKEIVVALSIIFAISLTVVVRYKAKGLISVILSVGYAAILLLVVRYANVKISLDGIAAVIIAIILNYSLQIDIIRNSMKKEDERLKLSKVFIKNILVIIPVFIISLAFVFSTSLLLNSFGMALFWGIIIMLVYNLLFVKMFE